MTEQINRNFGVQPLAQIMQKLGLTSHDIVAASTEQITHKMVARAMKGRRLTPHVQEKILRALNSLAQTSYELKELFDY